MLGSSMVPHFHIIPVLWRAISLSSRPSAFRARASTSWTRSYKARRSTSWSTTCCCTRRRPPRRALGSSLRIAHRPSHHRAASRGRGGRSATRKVRRKPHPPVDPTALSHTCAVAGPLTYTQRFAVAPQGIVPVDVRSSCLTLWSGWILCSRRCYAAGCCNPPPLHPRPRAPHARSCDALTARPARGRHFAGRWCARSHKTRERT